MVLCIEIDQDTKAKLDLLMRLGQYRDLSQTVAVAIANQVVLHEKVSEKGHSWLLGENTERADQRAAQKVTKGVGASAPQVAAVFSLPVSRPANWKPAPIPSDAFVTGASVPVDRWIFGQHNKLLPAKASCRALAALCADGKGMPLEKAASEIASSALELGDYLRGIDEKNGFARDEALAYAFPVSTTDEVHKARLRYANQFVASINKQGQLAGLLVDLKLVNYTPGKEPRLVLTQPGWDFAAIENPILDRGSQGLPKFSEEEIAFLLSHIRLRVPAEDCAYRTVTTALTNGANNPEKLDAFLARLVSARQDRPFTDAFLATQRSGAISRMADLGLVEKQRDQRRVTYIPTERAIRYVSDSEAVGRILK